uniref:Uncharacterized protein n=1 Tax=Octopus bimaculoides TaxID=37653 RepID=A0A0L8FUF7_OCTBM
MCVYVYVYGDFCIVFQKRAMLAVLKPASVDQISYTRSQWNAAEDINSFYYQPLKSQQKNRENPDKKKMFCRLVFELSSLPSTPLHC